MKALRLLPLLILTFTVLVSCKKDKGKKDTDNQIEISEDLPDWAVENLDQINSENVTEQDIIIADGKTLSALSNINLKTKNRTLMSIAQTPGDVQPQKTGEQELNTLLAATIRSGLKYVASKNILAGPDTLTEPAQRKFAYVYGSS